MKPRNGAFIFFICLLVFLASSAFAGEDNSKVGTTIFNFLKIENGARPLGMGGAFTGLADDENSFYYNPAGILDLDGKRYIAGYHNNMFEMQSGMLGYIHPLGEDKSIGLQVNYLNYGDFVETDADGNELGTFGGSDIVFAGTFAMTVKSNVQFGANAKIIYEKIENYSSTGLALDLGGKFILSRDRYSDSVRTSAGIAIQNLGTQMSTYVDGGEKYSLPVIIRTGFAATLQGLPFLVAADVIKPLDNDFFFAFGAEVIKLHPLYLRFGYSTFGTNYKTDSGSNGLAGFSAGFGVKYNNMHFSYTLTPQADLGTSHRITFTGGIK